MRHLILSALLLTAPVLSYGDAFCVSGSPCIYASPVSSLAITPAVSSCPDTAGNHLNFNSTTGAWSCGTSVPAATGDVVGPSSSVDNTLVRFDGTTGKLVQGYTSNAPVCTDSGVCTLVAPTLTTPTLQSSDSAFINTVTTSSTFTTANTGVTNSLVDLYVMNSDSTGSPANGLGTSMRFGAETSTTVDTTMGRVGMSWTDVTHATRTSNFTVGLVSSASAVTTAFTLTPTTSTFTGTVTSSATGSLGWSVVAAANQACTTTCTSAAVFGFDGTTPVGPADATADTCLCAGSN